MPDPIFADPRLAAIYDDVDGDRADLDHDEAIVEELGARSVLDIGCGTGAFGCRLAARGLAVVGVDPAQASLDVARSKAGADRVTWLLGDATTLPPMEVAVATMTGNVAQVFLTDEEWFATLVGARHAIREGGHLVFEVRDPSYRGWEEWTREASRSVSDTAAGRIENWVELTSVSLPLVSFRHSFRFLDTGAIVTSDSTLRFRNRHEITSALLANGFTVEEIRDAPRPTRPRVRVSLPRQSVAQPALWGRSSARLEVMSERLSDDLRDRDSLILRTAGKSFLEFRIEPDGLDRRGCRAEPWPAPLATAGDDLVDVVASLGFVGQLLDEVVVDGLA